MLGHKKSKVHPATIIIAGFALLIVLGSLLLMLPVSARSGRATPFLTCLFTATSATCVTGLVTVSTAVHWSNFGQLIILLLIQCGGLGFMTVATLASLVLRRTITLKERMVLSTGLNLVDHAGIVRLTRRVLFGTLLFEGIGAVILSVRFALQNGHPFYSIKLGVFHAVSAFCNAGFDLFGTAQQPFTSLVGYVADPVVNFTVMLLIVIGGLGFYVWGDVVDHRQFRRLRLHSKLVLLMTMLLLLGGILLTLLFEWSNPNTLGDLPLPQKLLAAAFQSVTLRTAGFNTIDQSALTGGSQALGCLLMLIGGSPGSTAGGIKTVTVAVLLATAISALRGKTRVVVFGRTIALRSIMNAVTMVMLGIVFVFAGACALTVFDGMSFHMNLFEAASAFGTVGLTMGITPLLSVGSQIVLILLMYMGRVGVLTVGVAVLMRHQEPPKLGYPEGSVMVG